MTWRVYDSEDGDIFPFQDFDHITEAIDSLLGTPYSRSIVDDMADWLDIEGLDSKVIADSVVRDQGERIIVRYMESVQEILDSGIGQWSTSDGRLSFEEVQ